MSGERIEPAGYCLAQQVEMPLLVRRASDILSKWGDEAEKNIGRAFRQAAGDGAILQIADQARMLLCRQAWGLGLPEPLTEARACVDRIRTLTSGDYAAVARRNRFHPVHSAKAFVTALEEECALQENRAQVMGFV